MRSRSLIYEGASWGWATGQQPAEEEHLGALLTWIDPPAGAPIQEAIAAAERLPMGVKTDPEFDRTVLDGIVEEYDRATRGQSSATGSQPPVPRGFAQRWSQLSCVSTTARSAPSLSCQRAACQR
jgi:hypothetical protein